MVVLRERGVSDNPVYDDDLEKTMMTIWIHHGGALLSRPHRRYIGGAVDCFDYMDGSRLGLEDLKALVSDCRPLCDKNKTRFYFKCKDDFDKGCKCLKRDNDCMGLLRFFRKGNKVQIFVEHDDLDSMLRAEATAGEIRQDDIEDVEYGDENLNSMGSVFIRAERDVIESDSASEGLVDSEYDMEDDDALFDLNVDLGVENDGPASNYTQFFSSTIHDQLNASDGDIDLADEENVLRSDDDGYSSGDEDHSKLSSFPKFNPLTDSRHPRFEIGMLFSSREELKSAITTFNVKDARDTKFVRNEKNRVRVICKDPSCKWFIYAKKLSGESGLQIRKWHLYHTCIPVYNTEVCKVRKYLCSTCKGHGHNSRACKKQKDGPNVQQQESMEHSQVNMSQTSINNATGSSQTTTTRPSRLRGTYRPIATPTVGVAIRAPPPMVGTFMPTRVSFKPPASKPPVLISQGKKYVAMKDLIEH